MAPKLAPAALCRDKPKTPLSTAMEVPTFKLPPIPTPPDTINEPVDVEVEAVEEVTDIHETDNISVQHYRRELNLKIWQLQRLYLMLE